MVRVHLLCWHFRPFRSAATGTLILAVMVLWMGACDRSARQYHFRDSALQKLAVGDTAGVRRMLSSVNWRKWPDADMMILLSRLYRADKTITGRLKAQQLLEDAVGKFPNDHRLYVELGKTYYEQTFYPDAEDCFRTALQLDADACEAHYFLAANHFRKWKRNQHFTDELTEASRHFKNASACNPSNTEWSVKRAICSYCRNDLNLAYAICRDVLRRDSTCSKMFFLEGTISFRRGQYTEAEQAFDKALSLLPEEEKETYLDISILLSSKERNEYEGASLEERMRWRRMFWMALDPDPTVPVNERFLEHISRTFLADVFFSNDRPRLRGWETERGKALIKFGWPASINRTLADMRGESLDGWAEIWTYGGAYSKEFIFVDEFLNGTFCIPRDLQFSTMTQLLLNSRAQSTFELDATPVPGNLDVVAFKNGSISSSVYTIARMDADSLLSCFHGSRPDSYIMRCVFFNSLWEEQDRCEQRLPAVEQTLSREEGKNWLYTERECRLPFDRFRISLAFSDSKDKTRSIFRDVVVASRFLGDSLCVSDLLLCREDSLYPSVPKLERDGTEFIPNPGHMYTEGEKLNIYLEVYNLIPFQSKYEYEVSYMIYQRPDTTEADGWVFLSKSLKWFAGIEEKQPPFIIQTATRQSFALPAKEIMAVNIDSLREGDYLLRVSVFDKYSGEIAEISTTFAKTGTKETPE